MNHINKDSRPDLLEGINVEVEPGGGRTALNQNVEYTGEKVRDALGSGLRWRKKSSFKKCGNTSCPEGTKSNIVL